MQTRKAPQKNVKKAPKKQKKQPRQFHGVGVKSIVGLCFVCAVLIGVLVAPSPYEPAQGGIKLIGNKREVAVYGPELPENIIEGYSQPVNVSNIVKTVEEEDTNLYVYAADGAERYHLGTCKFAYASAHRLTIMEAHFLGYEPCGRCDPPSYEEYYG